MENRTPVESVENRPGFPHRRVEAQTLVLTWFAAVFHSFHGPYGFYCFLKIKKKIYKRKNEVRNYEIHL